MAATADRQTKRLPVITVARLQEALRLIERLADEKAEIFLARGQEFREQYRNGGQRPLEPEEVALIARAMQVELAEAQRQIDAAHLTTTIEPAPQEVMMAAGLATAPEFVDATLRVLVLIEMDEDQFRDVYGRGPDAIDEAIDEALPDLHHLAIGEARQRAQDALGHLAREAGDDEGKGLRLVAKAIQDAMNRAATMMGEASASPSVSSTGSARSTDGHESTPSTESGGERPAT